MVERNEHRSNLRVRLALRNAEAPDQLDAVAQKVSERHIFLGDAHDTAGRNILIIDELSGCNGRQDGDLAAGIEAFHIRRRVTLRIAKRLRLRQCVLVRHLIVKHLRKHVVGGTVQDTEDARSIARGERGVQGANDRDTAADARLELEVQITLARDLQEFRTASCDQRLIRGHRTLTRQQSRLHVLVRRVNTAHDLHHDVDLGIA